MLFITQLADKSADKSFRISSFPTSFMFSKLVTSDKLFIVKSFHTGVTVKRKGE